MGLENVENCCKMANTAKSFFFSFLFFSFLLVTSQKRGKGCHTGVMSQIR